MKFFDDRIQNEGTVADLKSEYQYRQQKRAQAAAPKDFLGNPTVSVFDPDAEARMGRIKRDGGVLAGTAGTIAALALLNKMRLQRKRRKACEYLETEKERSKCYRDLAIG